MHQIRVLFAVLRTVPEAETLLTAGNRSRNSHRLIKPLNTLHKTNTTHNVTKCNFYNKILNTENSRTTSQIRYETKTSINYLFNTMPYARFSKSMSPTGFSHQQHKHFCSNSNRAAKYCTSNSKGHYKKRQTT